MWLLIVCYLWCTSFNGSWVSQFHEDQWYFWYKGRHVYLRDSYLGSYVRWEGSNMHFLKDQLLAVSLGMFFCSIASFFYDWNLSFLQWLPVGHNRVFCVDDLFKWRLCLFNLVGRDEKRKGGVSLGMKIPLWNMKGGKEAKFTLSYVYSLTGECVLI